MWVVISLSILKIFLLMQQKYRGLFKLFIPFIKMKNNTKLFFMTMRKTMKRAYLNTSKDSYQHIAQHLGGKHLNQVDAVH